MKIWKILFIPAELIYPKDRIAGATLARLEEGLKVWRQREHDFIVVSGGIFLPKDVQTEPAAILMKRWLIEQGVSDICIIAETSSLDTFWNVNHAHAVLRSRGLQYASWTVVSHATHLRRILITCRTYGIQAFGHPVNYRLSWKTRLGELFAWLIHWIDPRDGGWIARRSRRKRAARTWRPKALIDPR